MRQRVRHGGNLETSSSVFRLGMVEGYRNSRPDPKIPVTSSLSMMSRCCFFERDDFPPDDFPPFCLASRSRLRSRLRLSSSSRFLDGRSINDESELRRGLRLLWGLEGPAS